MHNGSSTRVPAALSADAVLADTHGVWAVCETKTLGAITGASRIQVLGYRDALAAPQALLTDGVHWMLWAAVGSEPLLDLRATNADELLSALAPHLERSRAQQRAWSDSHVWRYGRGLAVGLPPGAAPASWDPAMHSDPVGAALTRSLSEFVDRHAPLTTKDARGSRLFVRLHIAGRPPHSRGVRTPERCGPPP